MGNYSRDPDARLVDAESKHYVGVRVQQGVPLLDADLHLVDSLHRSELESVGRWMLGSGVPVGSDAFRVSALAGGGVKTVVLTANTAGTGPSSISVNVASSTAAAALGFDASNATASRTGSAPAQVISGHAEPFVLTANTTLVVSTDGGANETVTFVPADFVNIAAATAAEIVTKIAATVARFTPSAGAGGDFLLSGGDGTTAGAGRMLVDGRMVLIERALSYSQQPLYKNAALAAAWGVPQVDPLPTPAVNEVQTVFVDVWHREVDRVEDPVIVDSRIGIETAVSVRREWAVRAIPDAQYAAALVARPAGHSYYPIAQLKRGGGDAHVTSSMISDARETDASLRTEVSYRNSAGVVVVGTDRFRAMLALTRDAARDLVTFLTTKFVLPSASYLAGEIAGIESLSAIASAADHAIGAINLRTLNTKGSFGIMQQLYDAERRFVSTWEASVLPLVKSGTTPYAANFSSSITVIKALLDGPPPGGNVPIKTALAAGDLAGAVTSQERIGAELASQSGRPQGTIALKYLGSASPLVIRNVPIDLRYEVSGTLAPDDDLDLQVFIDPAWTVTFKNGDGSTPFALHVGPGVFTRQFFVSVTPPNLAVAQSLFSVDIHSRKNPAGVAFLTAQKTLSIGSAPPLSEDQFAITVHTASVPANAGILQVTKSTMANVTFRFNNNTGAAVAIDVTGTAGAAGWTLVAGPELKTNVSVPALGFTDFVWHFTAPGTSGTPLSFTLTAKDHTNPATTMADITLSFVSV
jgi:hypothetical protein